MSTGPDDVPASGFVLILGGTAEARALALAATSVGVPVVSSLAGRVSNPALPVGPVRIGGFGGVAGLVDYLTAHRVTAVVDATHPFAATISASAVNACGAAGFPLLRLARPGWSGRQDASTWHWVDSVEAAGMLAMELGHRAFLTTGRQTLAAYEPMTGRFALIRVVEPPTEPLSACWELITDRGPYRLDRELSLLREHRIDVLVTKDSGGSYTTAKLDAAAALDVPVVVIERPPSDAATSVDNVEDAIGWLTRTSTVAEYQRSDHRGQERG